MEAKKTADFLDGERLAKIILHYSGSDILLTEFTAALAGLIADRVQSDSVRDVVRGAKGYLDERAAEEAKRQQRLEDAKKIVSEVFSGS